MQQSTVESVRTPFGVTATMDAATFYEGESNEWARLKRYFLCQHYMRLAEVVNYTPNVVFGTPEYREDERDGERIGEWFSEPITG